MTLIFKHDLDMFKMYRHTKMKFLSHLLQKLQPWQTDRHTHTHMHTQTNYENITSPACAGYNELSRKKASTKHHTSITIQSMKILLVLLLLILHVVQVQTKSLPPAWQGKSDNLIFSVSVFDGTISIWCGQWSSGASLACTHLLI